MVRTAKANKEDASGGGGDETVRTGWERSADLVWQEKYHESFTAGAMYSSFQYLASLPKYNPYLDELEEPAPATVKGEILSGVTKKAKLARSARREVRSSVESKIGEILGKFEQATSKIGETRSKKLCAEVKKNSLASLAQSIKLQQDNIRMYIELGDREEAKRLLAKLKPSLSLMQNNAMANVQVSSIQPNNDVPVPPIESNSEEEEESELELEE